MTAAEWADEEPDWEERKDYNTSGRKFYELAAELRQHPGQWAKYPGNYRRHRDIARGIIASINAGRRPTFPGGLFEAKVDTSAQVWVRYRGVEDED